MLFAFLFILGATVGSFLNVCIWRLPRKESISHPPSHCPHCNTRLRALDLIPLLSQFFLRGRCRYCGAKFSWRYFGIELLTAVLFVLAGAQPGMIGGDWNALLTGDPWRLGRDLIFISCLLVVFWVDYDTKLIQLESVFVLGVIGVAWEMAQLWQGKTTLAAGVTVADVTFFQFPAPLPGAIVALVVTAAALWLVREFFSWIYQREALGFGDVMLVGGIAANLGWNATIWTFFFLSVVGGAFIAILMQIPRAFRTWRWAKKRRQRYGSTPAPPAALLRHAFRKGIPFGPMLAAGAIAALLYGAQLNTIYLNLWNAPVPGAINTLQDKTAVSQGLSDH
jgi:leader peptidase (prepilin peptidase)/N-methyltransferase